MKYLTGLILLLIFISFIFNNCTTTTHIYSDSVKGTDFTKYKTYAWLPGKKDTATKSVLNNEIVQQNIRQRVNMEMENRGFKLDTTKPDVLVLVHTMFEQKKDVVQTPLYSSYDYFYPGFYTGIWYPYYYGYYYNVPRVVGYDIREVQYTEGTIVIDIIDREKNTLVWRGWAENRISKPDEFQKTLGSKIGKIFEKYPVQSKVNETYP
jgi:hypothetical protein